MMTRKRGNLPQLRCPNRHRMVWDMLFPALGCGIPVKATARCPVEGCRYSEVYDADGIIALMSDDD